jgi:pSer/pThr/pTyr-binding forkhead associated (FHA) protein
MSVKVSITVTDGPDAGKTFEFTEGAVTLGRGKSNFVLADKKISGKHCQFTVEGNDVFVEDLNSTNGTFIGGKRLDQKKLLQNLDEIVVGLSKLSVAIIEQISDFRAKNQVKAQDLILENDDSLEILTPIDEQEYPLESNEAEDPSTNVKVEPAPAVEAEVELPPDDAVYRETGIRRIEDLIQDEMEAFSKWDHPAVADAENSGNRIGVPRIKISLTLRRSPDGGTNAVCTKSVTTLGRKDVDVRVNDLDCSRKHAAVEIVAGDKAFVRDLASTNGTYVNGKRIAYQELKNGDLLQIGQTIYEVLIERAV